MSVQQHLETLTEKHRKLDSRIAQETARPAHDATKVKELKRQKLKIKEEISRLT